MQTLFDIEKSIGYSYLLLQDSNAFLALTNGVTSFMWFKSMKIPTNKFINTIAASTFGVLLIHANSDTMRCWIWRDVVDCTGHFDTPYYWAYSICCVLIIYIACTFIDYIRIKTVETPMINAAERTCDYVKSKFLKD